LLSPSLEQVKTTVDQAAIDVAKLVATGSLCLEPSPADDTQIATMLQLVDSPVFQLYMRNSDYRDLLVLLKTGGEELR